MKVSVVYALPEKPFLYEIELSDGASVQDAIKQSGLLTQCPDVSLAHVGIFGREVPLDTRVVDGDRVEVYRPLPVDPKEARRQRSAGII